MSVRARARTIPAPAPTILPATDLGNVEVAKHGNLYLLTDPRGDIRIDGRGLGLYELDTRILSTSILRLNGVPLTLLRGPYRDATALDTIQLTNPELAAQPRRQARAAVAPAHVGSCSVTRTRRLHGGLHEQVDDRELLGDGRGPRHRARARRRHGRHLRGPRLRRGRSRGHAPARSSCPTTGSSSATTGSTARRRTTTVGAEARDRRTGRRPRRLAGRERARRALGPRLEPDARLTVGWTVTTTSGRPTRPNAPSDADGAHPAGAADGRHGDVRAEVPTAPPSCRCRRARGSLSMRRGSRPTTSCSIGRSRARSPTWRCSATTGPARASSTSRPGSRGSRRCSGATASSPRSRRCAFIPTFAVATLDVLARLQATTDDPWHDAEPGKILHELRTGEMARAGETPHDAYYGSVDSTPLWLILLGETHAWTGDDALLDRLWPNALAALAWIDDSGDLDGDGFVEYQRRSRLGLLNQGWKDSGDAIRHVDGRPAEAPIALAEVQGYVYAARRAMARLARHRGEHRPGRAARGRRRRARRPVRRGVLAARRRASTRWRSTARSARSRASARTPGRRCGPGSSRPTRAGRVAERLLEPGHVLAAGASGRSRPASRATTRSATTPGSIWPHDNALIAAGLKASGAADGANLLAGRLIEAAQWFPDLRLPELFCGFARDEVGAPVAYPVACSPQAWAAAAPFYLLHTMLGLRADATRPPARARSGRPCPSG